MKADCLAGVTIRTKENKLKTLSMDAVLHSASVALLGKARAFF